MEKRKTYFGLKLIQLILRKIFRKLFAVIFEMCLDFNLHILVFSKRGAILESNCRGRVTCSDAIWKKHFCFFRKKLFFMTKKTWPPKKTPKKCFFCFFHNKLCIKEKRKVVLLIWGPGDPVCPREVKITPPTPSCSPLCGSVCGNWPNWGLLCKLVAKTFFFLCLYDVCC